MRNSRTQSVAMRDSNPYGALRIAAKTRCVTAWQGLVNRAVRRDRVDTAMGDYRCKKWCALCADVERAMRGHGYTIAQIARMRQWAYVIPWIDNLSGVCVSVITHKPTIDAWLEVCSTMLYRCRLEQMRSNFGRTARDNWQMIRQAVCAKLVIDYWLERTQRRLCAPGGAGRAADLAAFVGDFR